MIFLFALFLLFIYFTVHVQYVHLADFIPIFVKSLYQFVCVDRLFQTVGHVFLHLPQYCFSVHYLIEMAPTDSELVSVSVTYMLD